MFKRILPALLIATLIVGFSSTVASALTGSLSIHISLVPQTTAYEKASFDIDLQMGLKLKFAISGLGFSLASAFGITGIEHAIFGLGADLGALSVEKELVFATPFRRGPPLSSVSFAPIGPLLFVKKRVTAELSIGGLTFENLAIFEDVTFRHPFPTGTANYGTAHQAFGFGNVITVTGETPDSVKITLQAGLCATSARNRIKKRSFAFSVSPQCSPLLFDFGKILIEKFKLGPVSFDTGFVFKPAKPAEAKVTSSFSRPPFSIVAELVTADITNLKFIKAVVTLSAPGIEVTQTFSNALALLTTDASVTVHLDSTPANLATALRFRSAGKVAGAEVKGLTRLKSRLSVGLGAGAFLAFTTCFGRGTAVGRIESRCDEATKTPIEFAFASFSVEAAAGPFIASSAAFFGFRGLRGAEVELTAKF